MIERVMSLPIFMFTRVSLSILITSIAGMMTISFLYLAWTFAEDIYLAVSPEKEVAVEEASIDEFPHIQPIKVTARKRPIG